MFKKIIPALLILPMVSGVTLAADMVIGVANWPSANVSAQVIKKVLEDNLGIEVELQPGTNPIIFEGMSRDSMHVHPEVWLPNQANLANKHKAHVVRNKNAADTFQGMCSNAEARKIGVDHIHKLTNPDIASQLDRNNDGRGDIYIGATGWASTTVEKVKARGYGYSETMDLMEIDETVAYAQLDDANKKGKPWVGFCYKPHHLFIIHPDLEAIPEPAHEASNWKVYQPDEDPDWLNKSSAAMAWPTAKVQIYYAKSLQSKLSEAARVLDNFAFNSDDISGFSFGMVVEGKDPDVVANEWIKANQSRVGKWIN